MRLKYVIFKHGAMLLPVIFPEHVTHSMINLEDCQVHSAGFFTLSQNHAVEVLPEISESLKIGPKQGDHRLLQLTFLGFGTSSFIDYDNLS